MAIGSLPDELKWVVQTHRDKTEEICNSFSSELASTPAPAINYHYTDDRGLKGILETGRLWFTNLFNLNDPSELNHGIEHALAALKSEVEQGPRESKFFYQQFERALAGNVESTANYFVCCFSKTGDDLGQWRAYADDGHGYAIGFDGGVLEKAFAGSATTATNSYSTFPVTYDDKKLREIHAHLVAETIPAISAPRGMNLSGEVLSQFLRTLSVRLASMCCMASLYFKHEAYSNEQEYRFLEIYPAGKPVPDLLLRSQPYTMVKYREFDWKGVAAESLKEVVFGPAGDQEIAIKFAEDCLREYIPAVGTTSIRRSQIPYKSVRT